jgi:hypothetical protein
VSGQGNTPTAPLEGQPLPRALREECPECGMPTEQQVSVHYEGDYYVDRFCPFCEWREIDTEGGI